MTDTLSGETVSYESDALKRLIQASSDTGNPATSWVQAYQFDGFGNLTQKALAVGGGSPTITSSAVNGFNVSTR